ncbi:hypothetical protein DEFDS_1795 [Deferribacter desulfuricans SSM1]|uniref:Uncharacterized protein n=1 Tax=Deferribacter desulfuricans (strain DSM 14783 / JCM 11476 / NBRC 101012 / SSM1) TaxID=639282 RepID=D3P960_DEFDS|nr:hypothetical protein DEFDS_1795 [Deferribacter desulfuricans SSM1]
MSPFFMYNYGGYVKKKLLVFLSLFYLFSCYAFSFANIEPNNFNNDGFIKQILSYSITTEAKIDLIQNDKVKINKGFKNGYFIGRKVLIYKKGDSLGKIGDLIIRVGIGKVIESNSNSAIILIEKKYKNIENGDLVKPYVKVKLSFLSYDKELNKLFAYYKNKLVNDFNFVIDDKNPNLIIEGSRNNNIANIKIRDKNGDKIGILNVDLNDYLFDIPIKKAYVNLNLDFKEGFYSVSVLKYKDKYYYALATKHFVDLYELENNKKFTKIDEVKIDGDIVSVESFDINNDNIDNLIINCLNNKLKVSTKIYKFKKDKLVLEKNNIPYLFRTTYHNNEKILLYQKVVSEKFDNKIYKFVSLSNLGGDEYVTPIKSDINIMNTSFGYINNNNIIDILYFDKNGKVNILIDNNTVYQSSISYNSGLQYIMLNKNAKEKDDFGYKDNDDFFKYLKFRYYVYPRLNYDNGNFVAIKNYKKFPNIPRLDVYKNSEVILYRFDGSHVVKKWSSGRVDPQIVDVDYIDGNINKLVILKKSVSGIFKKESSHLIIMELE